MKKLMMIALAACVAAITGCNSPAKVRDVDVKGMYVNGYTEVLAIGRGTVTSIPSDKEAFAAHYEEDTAWLSPSTKTHALDLFLVGTNTVENSAQIVESICRAFAEVAPTVSSNNVAVAKGGGTVFTYFAGNHQQTAAANAIKAAASAGMTNAVEALVAKVGPKLARKFIDAGGDASKAVVTTTTAADGTTTTTCTDGACTVCTDCTPTSSATEAK
ncbi:MAG: hypothetical protein IKO72_08935 [Kiritimatiellae bacterium]|nr:hypothetical protein [Kiritimatiellia bacterium]